MLAVFFLYFDDPVVITKYCLCITKMTAFIMKKPRKFAEVRIFTNVYNLSLMIFLPYVLRKLPHRM